MPVLVVTHPSSVEHLTGPHHPERPERLDAVLAGLADSGLGDELVFAAARLATTDELVGAHDRPMVEALETFCLTGGGHIDGDTVAVQPSWNAAVHAAGAGLVAIERLQAGGAQAAFVAVRPPGHHATANRSMGFCLLNNVAVAAAHLAAQGERVLIVDFDAHHGNGTQDIFWQDDRVTYASFHEYPQYPGTGRLTDVGAGAGLGSTVNVPFPMGATGDRYREAIDAVLVPYAEAWQPTWLLLSAGFDAHRDDPLTDLGLTSGDFGAITEQLVALVPPGRTVAFLEGGYDLAALRSSTAACVAALGGREVRPEDPSSNGPGRDVVSELAVFRRRFRVSEP